MIFKYRIVQQWCVERGQSARALSVKD